MAEAKQDAQSQSSFALEISVKEQKLCMKVTDTKSKQKHVFQSSFTPKQLLSCGFNEAQAGNLDGLHRFIEIAKASKEGLKLNISIIQQDDNDIKCDKEGNNELEEGPGVLPVNYAQIIITKKDQIFGSMRFIMKLKEIQRNEQEINKEIIDDIKEEINVINQKLTASENKMNKLKQNWMASSSTLSIKVGILNGKLTETQQFAQQLTNRTNHNKEKLNDMKQEIDHKLQHITKTNEVKLKKEMQGLMNKTRNQLSIDIMKLKEELTKSFRNELNTIKAENVALKEEIKALKQQQLPKGSIIEWNGCIKDIPIGWILYDEEEKKTENNDNVFKYESDFDEKGIIYFIGSNQGTQKWENPSNNNLVKIQISGSMNQGSIHDIIGRKSGVNCYVDHNENNYIIIDFIDIQIKPTNYTLRHGCQYNDFLLRWWTFSGSNDGEKWMILKEHNNDKSLNGNYATKTWNIDNGNKYFRYFRIYMTGKDSSNYWYLNCSGFEIYGEIKSEPNHSNSRLKTAPKIIKIV